MATMKTKDTSLADIANELGVSLDSLNSMDLADIKKIMKSGDLDPAQKAKLVKAKLAKAQQDLSDAVDLSNSVLADDCKQMPDDSSNKSSKSSKSASADY